MPNKTYFYLIAFLSHQNDNWCSLCYCFYFPRYYADLEYNKCYSLAGGLPDLVKQGNACIVWRRFANLFETSQSLFWASFGLVSLTDFELTGIKEFTRFWALLMFGSYRYVKTASIN